MYGIYANIWGILMGSMLPYIAYMDPMGHEALVTDMWFCLFGKHSSPLRQQCALATRVWIPKLQS